MSGFYPLGSFDAHRLALMIGQLSDARTRVQRADMTLYCWSRMWANRKPCSHFTCGIRTIADECHVSEKAARCFLDKAEADGWLVRLGTKRNRTGEYVMRTFLWVAEEAADDAGMGLEEWLASVRGQTPAGGGCAPNGADGCAPNGADPAYFSQQNRADGCALSLWGKGTHQNAEHSEGGCSAHSSDEDALASASGDYDVDLTPGWLGGADA